MKTSSVTPGFNQQSLTNLNLAGYFPSGSQVTLPLPEGAIAQGNLNITLWAMSPNGRVRAGVFNSNTMANSNPINISGVQVPMLQFNGAINAGSNIITNVSSFIGLAEGQVITAYGIPTGTTILRFDPINRIITMSNAATSSFTYQIINTDGSNYSFEMEAIYSVYGQPGQTQVWSGSFSPIPVSAPRLVFNQQAVTNLRLGSSFPANAQVSIVDPPANLSGNLQVTLWLLLANGELQRLGWYSNIFANSNPIYISGMSLPGLQLNGTLTTGSKTITNISSFLGIATGQVLTTYGLPAGTTITAFDPVHSTITVSNAATLSGQNQLLNSDCTNTSVFLKAEYTHLGNPSYTAIGWSGQLTPAG